MVAETIKEVKVKSITGSKAVAIKQLGDLMELGLKILDSQTSVVYQVIGPERREERNQIMLAAMGEIIKTMLPQVEKALKTLNLPNGDKYMFGDSISIADLEVIS